MSKKGLITFIMLKKIQWYINRFASMDIQEIVYRIQQAVAVQKEKRFGVLRNSQGEIDMLVAWSLYQKGDNSVFFFEMNQKQAIRASYEKNFCQGKSQTLSVAEKLLSDNIKIFNQPVQLDAPVNWFKDPASGRLWPDTTFWGDVDIRDGHSVGGVKWVWELNRHHHIVTLAKAYFLTDDERYAEKACQHLDSWLAQNTPGKGVHWTSSLELGLRVINWSWALAFLRGSDALKRPLFEKIALSAADQCDQISRHLSKFSSANNHLVGEAAGLVFGGIFFSFFPQATQWRDLGLQIMADEVDRQIHPDGTPAEQAMQYFTFLLDFNLHVWRLAKLNQFPVPAAWYQRVVPAIKFITTMLTKNGRWIPIGDSDNAWVVRLDDLQETTRFRSFLAALPLEIGQLPSHIDEKSFWMFGAAALQTDTVQVNPASTLFKDGGYAVMRHDQAVLTMDFGPLGYLATAAHGHADALSVNLMLGEQPLLIDPNTYAFQEGYEWRDYFRSTLAHNTITIDGQNQSEMLGSFLWGRRAKTTLVHWETQQEFDLIVAEHDGYQPLGVTHRRALLFRKPNQIFIFDHLLGIGSHDVEQTWHLPADLEITQENNRFEIGGDQKITILLLDSQNSGKVSLISGEEDPIQGWDSPSYGVKHPAPAVSLKLKTQLPLILQTRLLIIQSDEKTDEVLPSELVALVNQFLI